MAEVQTSLQGRTGPWSLVISLLLFAFLILAWHLATVRPAFNPKGLSEEQLMTMEFNGDIIRSDDGTYIYNPEKLRGIPGPLAVARKSVEEVGEAFHKKGTNDHGIGHLVRYTVMRFGAGFLSASLVAVCIGVVA